MSEPSFVAETLVWCNERRKEKGMEPLDKLPKGKRGDPKSCPCGKATGLSVGVVTYAIPDVNVGPILYVTQDVTNFVTAFDVGHLPQYEEES